MPHPTLTVIQHWSVCKKTVASKRRGNVKRQVAHNLAGDLSMWTITGEAGRRNVYKSLDRTPNTFFITCSCDRSAQRNATHCANLHLLSSLLI